jgi:hypothetical protein
MRTHALCCLVTTAWLVACANGADGTAYTSFGGRGGSGSTSFGGSGNAAGSGDQDGAACIEPTCASLFADCGSVPSPCGGTLSCGDCPEGLTCGGQGANRCGANGCTAVTCIQLGAACGVVSDQCSGVIDCGVCNAPAVCNAQNECVEPIDSGVGDAGAAGQGGTGGSVDAGADGSGAAAGQGAVPNCTDSTKNGQETDQDCGGGTCPACELGKACAANTDCQSQTCVSSRCVTCAWTDWKIPTAAVSIGSSSHSWYVFEGAASSLVAAVRANDSAYDVYDVLANSNSEALRCTGFAMGLQSDAIVTGIEAQVLRETSGAPTTNHDQVIQLVRSNARVGSNKARTTVQWPQSPSNFQWATYGGQSDAWGPTSWPGSSINDSTFGIDIAAHNYYGSAASTAYVDMVRIRVYACNLR